MKIGWNFKENGSYWDWLGMEEGAECQDNRNYIKGQIYRTLKEVNDKCWEILGREGQNDRMTGGDATASKNRDNGKCWNLWWTKGGRKSQNDWMTGGDN